MVLKAILDSLESVPEALREHYKQGEDGKYSLDVEAVGGFELSNTQGLRDGLAKERRRADDAYRKLQAFGELTPDQATKLQKDLEELRNANDPEKIAKITKQIEAEMESRYSSKLKEATEENTRLRSEVTNDKRAAAISAAIAEHGGKSKWLAPVLEKRVRLQESDGKFAIQVLDENGEELYHVGDDNTARPMSVSQFVGKLKTDPEWADAFQKPTKGGSGLPGSGEAGPNGSRREQVDRLLSMDFASGIAKAREQGFTE